MCVGAALKLQQIAVHLLPQGLVRSLARLASAQVSTVRLRMTSTIKTEIPHFPAQKMRPRHAKSLTVSVR